MSKPELTAARLRELLDYSPETGLFVWKVGRNQLVKAGDIAGTVNKRGYIQIGIDGKFYLAHRLAFLHMTGEFPPAVVDHINGTRSDNRWSNLRHAQQWENCGNHKGWGGKSGVRGVCWNKRLGKWRVQIHPFGRGYHLGYFSTIEEANACYQGAAQLVFGHFAHHLSKEAA